MKKKLPMEPMQNKLASELKKLQAEYDLLKAEVQVKIADQELATQRKTRQRDLERKMEKLKDNLANLKDAGEVAFAQLVYNFNKTAREIRGMLGGNK